MEFSSLGFGLIWDLSLLSSFLFLLFGMEMFILCLPHCCILEAHNVFGFPGSRLAKSLPQDDSYFESHTYLI